MGLGLSCLHTVIFMETPSLERLPNNTKEAPPHMVGLSPLDTTSVFIVILLFLFEVPSLKGWPIKASPQPGGYFNPDSEAAFWRMLSNWVIVQWSTGGNVNNIKIISKSTSSPLSLIYPYIFYRGSNLVPSTSVFQRTSIFHSC